MVRSIGTSYPAWLRQRPPTVPRQGSSAGLRASPILHATHARNPRIPDAEVTRAARWVIGLAAGAPCVLAGDFNVDTARSTVIDRLDGFSRAGPGVDHILARGMRAGPYDRWTPERRRLGQLALSDHAPVEVVAR